VIYPFIVNNPGEAAQAKRRIAALTIGHLPPPLAGAELSGANSADFTVNYGDSAPCGHTANSPLLPTQTCQITVYFDPSKVGAEKATYKLYDNSIGSPQILTLTGTGQN